MLYKALELKKSLLPTDYLQPVKKRTELEGELEQLLEQSINSEYKN